MRNPLHMLKKRSSGSIARDRLKLLLVSDRANCSPEIISMIKNDMVHVISKYMEVDKNKLEIQITQADSAGNGPMLYANIPIIEVKHDS